MEGLLQSISNMDRGERGGGRGQVGCALACIVRGVVVGGRWDVLTWRERWWGQVGSVFNKYIVDTNTIAMSQVVELFLEFSDFLSFKS